MFSQLAFVLAALLTRLDPGAALAALDRVVAPAPVETIAIDAVEPRASLQIEVLADPDAADAMAEQLRGRLDAAGHELPVFVESVFDDPDLPPAYRVGVGPFVDFEDAERARTALDDLGVAGFVRELDPIVGC